MEAGLRVHQGGSGEPALLLLHGLGATGDVWQGWRPVLAGRWPGRWLAPDLPGHGGGPDQWVRGWQAEEVWYARRRPDRTGPSLNQSDRAIIRPAA